MLGHLIRRPWKIGVLALTAALAVFVFGKWREASNHGGQMYAAPFRVAGNLFYVGANDADARAFDRDRKFPARASVKTPADPFVDPEGSRRYIDDAERQFRNQAPEPQ